MGITRKSCKKTVASLSLTILVVFVPGLFDVAYAQNAGIQVSSNQNNASSPILFDKREYTWTDRIYITIQAQDFNSDPNVIDTIGDTPDDKVTVSTRNHSIPYKLVETGPNTGIFSGYVTLTGDPTIKGSAGIDGNGANPTGITSTCSPVCGPTDGLLAAEENDAITVSFEWTRDRTITSTAPITWTVNQVSWLKPNYPDNGQAVLQIVDPDMSLDPKSINSFETSVWSDSDSGGIQLNMVETGPGTGIFQGTVYFTTDYQSSGSRLHVSDGDTITAEYIDRTLPPPYSPSDQLSLYATATVGTPTPSLEKIQATNPRITDSLGNVLSSLKANQATEITTDLQNTQNKAQPFVYLVQIKNTDNTILSLSWISGTLDAKQSLSVSQSWVPSMPGTYSAEILVWQGINNPVALSPQLSTTINVR